MHYVPRRKARPLRYTLYVIRDACVHLGRSYTGDCQADVGCARVRHGAKKTPDGITRTHTAF